MYICIFVCSLKGGAGYAYSSSSSAGMQTGGHQAGAYDTMSAANQVSTGIQSDMNAGNVGGGYNDTQNITTSSKFSSYKSESYQTNTQTLGGTSSDTQSFAYRAGSPGHFDGTQTMSGGAGGGTFRMQSMVLNTGGLLGLAGSRPTSPIQYMADEIKVDCVLMTSDGKYAVTGSGCGPPQVWDLKVRLLHAYTYK